MGDKKCKSTVALKEAIAKTWGNTFKDSRDLGRLSTASLSSYLKIPLACESVHLK